MALTRRGFLMAIPALSGVLAACNGTHGGGPRAAYSELFSIKAPRPNVGTIVVFMPQTEQTQDVWRGLQDEISQELRVVAVKVESAADVSIIEEAMARHSPAGLLLVNNPTVAAYREFQRRNAGGGFPPSVIVMTSFLEDPSAMVENATGIGYEVPLMMLMTDLRKVIALPGERVGVVARESLRRFVRRQTELARREQVVVSVEQVSTSPRPPEIKRAIRRLKQRVDVIWVLNDDQLLTPKLITDGWLPGLEERPWVPTIVGASSLVSPEHSLGTFAVLPDHVALGAQAAGLLLDIAAADWTVEQGHRVHLPRSTTSTLDLPQVREHFALQAHALEYVDTILE